MKIALYQPWIYQKGGMERTILEMTSSRSRHEWTVFTNHFAPATTFPEFRNRKVIELDRVPVRRGVSDLVRVALTIARQKLPLGGFDALVVSTAGFGEFITLRNHSLPAACYCHTPLRVVHDPAARQEFLSTGRVPLPAFKAFESAYTFLERRAWRHFGAVACNSRETRDRIVRGGLVAGPGKVSVFHPGVDVAALKPSWRFGNYFFAPGRISPLKNGVLAVEAFKEFSRLPSSRGFRLVVAGGVGGKDAPYLEELRRSARGFAVDVIPDPSDRRFFSLYRGARAVLFTATNEDWGIVPIEAMAFGKPVIAVNQGGPRESMEDGKSGFLVDASPAAISKAMARLAAGKALCVKMGRSARKRALEFDWANFVSQMDALVEKTASN